MTDLIDFIDENGNEWTKTNRFREAKETIAGQADDIRTLEIELGDVRDSFLYYKGKAQVQAVVIELYEQALIASWPEGAMGDAFDYWNQARVATTDSTQILDEVRRVEREKCAVLCEKSDRYRGDYFADKIRVME